MLMTFDALFFILTPLLHSGAKQSFSWIMFGSLQKTIKMQDRVAIMHEQHNPSQKKQINALFRSECKRNNGHCFPLFVHKCQRENNRFMNKLANCFHLPGFHGRTHGAGCSWHIYHAALSGWDPARSYPVGSFRTCMPYVWYARFGNVITIVVYITNRLTNENSIAARLRTMQSGKRLRQ